MEPNTNNNLVSNLNHQPSPSNCGYQSSISLSRASAFQWVPYSIVTATLRELGSASFPISIPSNLSLLISSKSFKKPFNSSCRFPCSDLYVCVDLPPVRPALMRIVRVVAVAESVGVNHGNVDEYFDAVRDAIDMLTLDGHGGTGTELLPVIFDQATFERVFQLNWIS